MLRQLGCLRYSPSLESHIRSFKPIVPGSNWEIELRGVSIWCVELIKREINKRHPEVKSAGMRSAGLKLGENHENPSLRTVPDFEGTVEMPQKPFGINAILIDFFLYDTMKILEEEENESIPHHRTRSIWY